MDFFKSILGWFLGLFSKKEASQLPIEVVPEEPKQQTVEQPLIKKGAKGKAVADLQGRLKELGYDVGVVDGDFGTATDAVVRKFQAEHGLTVDGWVGSKTWAALATAQAPAQPVPKPDHAEYKDSWFEMAIKITGSFEGIGYTQITGNFDGMGVSAGILQWNYGMGSLQDKILKPYRSRFGSINALGIFPKEADMDSSANMSTSAGVAFAKKYMLVGTALKADWKAAWKKFLDRPDVRILQREACENVKKSALNLCEAWDLVSPRAFCFFFDIITQNGSMKDIKRPVPSAAIVKEYIGYASSADNRSIWAKVSPDEEQMILFQAAWLRAKLSRSEYIQDVFNRKGTIALGKGVVHGDSFSFDFSNL